MDRLKLPLVLLLPSMVVGGACVKTTGLAVVAGSFMAVLLPIGQALVWLSWSLGGWAFPIAAAVWVAILIASQVAYTGARKNAVFAACVVFGFANAAFIPWAISTLVWYA